MEVSQISFGASLTLDVENDQDLFSVNTKLFDTHPTGLLLLPPKFSFQQSQMLKSTHQMYLNCPINGTIYRWECSGHRNETIKGLNVFQVFVSGKGASYNRRSAFRLPSHLTATASAASIDGVFRIYLRDISFIGICFEANVQLRIGDLLAIKLVTDKYSIEVNARIVRMIYDERGDKIQAYGAELLREDRMLRKYIIEEKAKIDKRA
ncbi:MAG TPA: PilZ domain-containing protein [Bacillota bacterium]|nr:PilZ domain-containing protein [Bacillota bacterium]